MSAPETGHRVIAGRYELHHPLGRGGAGEVWRGVDTRLGRPVAVKLIRVPPALDGTEQADARNRVLREARAAARVQHPAAVTMYDVLEVDDRELCLVMELVDAPDLGRVVVERGPLAPAVVARIGLELLDALEAAHGRGLVHRDVKPSNVLWTEAGGARLTDFGTTVIAGEDRLTASGLVFGSPAYMAPEQAVDVEVGPAADLWALGATLYQAVEGVALFSGPTAVATMYAVMHGEPRQAVRAGALQAVLDRLLVREVAGRAGHEETRQLLLAVVDGRTGGGDTAAMPRTTGPVAALVSDGHDGVPRGADRVGGAGAAAGGRDADGAHARTTSTQEGAAGTDRVHPPVLRRRAGRRVPIALVTGVVVLLLGAVGLARLAAQDGDPGVAQAGGPAPTAGPGNLAAPPAATSDDRTDPAATAGQRPTPTQPPPETGATAEVDGPADATTEAQPDPPADAISQGADGDATGAPTAAVAPPAMATVGEDADADADADDGAAAGGQGAGGGQGATGAGSGEAAVAALPAATVPEDWVAFAPDDAPYEVAHPPDWTIERLDATRTDISDPSSGAYLRLDWTDDPAPDPLANWEAYEPQFAEGREGYERIRMDATTFKGEPAALWEYRYVRSGTTYRAYNLNVSGGQYGYALNFQTTEAEWADLEPLFGPLAESYTIPG